MWFFLLLYVAHIVPAISQDDEKIKVILKGKEPCKGHAEVLYKGEWGYVGDTYWDKTTEETLCRSTDCGKPESHTYVLREMGKPVWLNEVVCKENSSDLTKCTHPGWNSSYYSKDYVKKIHCSKKIEIGFFQSPFKCAGAVMYKTSEGEKGYFCGSLELTDVNQLCKNLRCGESKEVLEDEWMTLKDKRNLKVRSINCLGIQNVSNLWQCVSSKTSCTNPVYVICKGHKRRQVRGETKNACCGRLEIEKDDKWIPDKNSKETANDLCKEIHCGEEGSYNKSTTELTCKKNVEVVLMDKRKPSTCYGEVYFKVDNALKRVCGSNWNKTNAEVVCKELNCGGVVAHLSNNINERGIMDNVKCSGKESSLWHCMAKRSDHDAFSCSSSAYVVCRGSIDVRLADGPGKCAGRVELLYEGQWQGVTTQVWTDKNADVVCTHLKCGKQAKTAESEKFSQGSGGSLDLSCNPSVSNISDCDITKNQNRERGEKEAVGITCEEHKVVFLKENVCSGTVGIEHAGKTYWLSGSKDTWNQESANTVCQQMHCGKADNYSFIPSADMMKDVWRRSYNCSSDSKSLFECKNVQLPSDYNETVASVKCSGDISVNLTKECWGYVNICTGGECDGVCNAAWTDKMSQMLCAETRCGNATSVKQKQEQSNVIFKSLHMTTHTTNLGQCNLVKKEKNNGVSCKKAYVVCTGSIKAKINVSSSRSKCSGNVEMHYEGHWLPVCKDALQNVETQNIICRELNCGQPLNLVDYFGPRAAVPPVISKIECPTNGNMSSCSISPGTSSCPLGHLQCSSWGHMDLKFGNACSGAVFVHSEGKKSSISPNGWSETASKQLCKDLKCGELRLNKTIPSTTKSTWPRNFNCGVGTPQNIWDCENSSQKETVTSDEQVFIECQGEPNVTLSKDCYGEVRINNTSVCHGNWKPEYSDLVCQEKGCGNVVPHSSSSIRSPKDESYHVSCEEYHYKLGQCNRYKAKCEDVVYVYCSGAVKFDTTETCGGRIQVRYGDKLSYLYLHSQDSSMKQKLCEALDCNGHNASIKNQRTKEKEIPMKAQLNCIKDNMDIERCVTINDQRAKPFQIYCNGYKSSVKPPESGTNYTVAIILGLGFLLIVMILIIVFIRIRMVRKSKRLMNASSRMLPGKEVESESGEYEPVTNENEMDVFSNGRFRSEDEFITENDAKSISYDDVGEAAESQPLTSPAVPAGTSGDSFFGDDAPNQSSDGVTYEVEDPQENYDDIEASPEFIQTKAEVHDVPEPAPESVTVATPGMVQGEEDYLVPGQDK